MARDMLSKPLLWGVGTVRTLRAHWVLNELGIDYETQPVKPRTDTMERADFLAVNPDKKVPVLQHGDLTLVESSAIMIYLAETYADRAPGLDPSRQNTKGAGFRMDVVHLNRTGCGLSLYHPQASGS
ncbi:glutathione S-transferase N-terminal domain-containing protein [Ruegeria sp. HKCCD7221]|nr:glutathione S-transferase N-terminal domain-containing protein [Ruegeria sp. HKCCD7221]